MNIDLRRFAYPLEPLRRMRRWQLDALLAKLGKAQEAVRQAQLGLDQLRKRHEDQRMLMLEAVRRRLEPGHYVRDLQWLAGLQAQIVGAGKRLAELSEQRARLQRQCQIQQYKVEVLDTHRDECLEAFAQEEAGRQAVEADRDWLIRAAGQRVRKDCRMDVRPGVWP